MRSFHSPPKGFNLISLLIAICSLGILARIIYPTYLDAIRTGQRGNAKGELMRLADLQEKWRLSHANYGALDDLGGHVANDYYTFSVSNNTNSEFSITAIPTSRNNQFDDPCGILQITQEHNLHSNHPNVCPRP